MFCEKCGEKLFTGNKFCDQCGFETGNGGANNNLQPKKQGKKIASYFWTVIILIVIILGAGFYWFQWRPSEIKKECSKYEDKTVKSNSYYTDTTKNEYTDCLHKSGLK